MATLEIGNMDLNSQIIFGINLVLAKECRPDAVEILSQCKQEFRDDFEEAFKNEDYNACCMTIDVAKFDLVKDGKMQWGECSSFGEYLKEIYNEMPKL